MRRAVLAVALLVASSSCTRAHRVSCPGQVHPDRLSDAELVRRGAADGLPAQGTNTLAQVRWAADHSRAMLGRDYRGVIDVRVGTGWGVTYSERHGAVTYHRAPDHMVEVNLRSASSCPSATSLNLFVPNRSGERIPVRFLFWSP